MSRVVFIVAALLWAVSLGGARADEPSAEFEVWKSPLCGCCGAWVAHMEANGFSASVHQLDDVATVKMMMGISEDHWACHTARIDGYFIEGHVPAEDVKRLLETRPDAAGLAVPGMPSGSPGMENGMHDAYDVLLVRRDGTVEAFSSYH